MLKEWKVDYRVHHVWDGVEGLEFLRKEGRHADAPKPDLIIMDLNLPKMSGHELLAIVKRDPALKRIPVIVLSTSAAEEDINRAYENYANIYFTKPRNLKYYDELIKVIEECWLNLARLPDGGCEEIKY